MSKNKRKVEMELNSKGKDINKLTSSMKSTTTTTTTQNLLTSIAITLNKDIYQQLSTQTIRQQNHQIVFNINKSTTINS